MIPFFPMNFSKAPQEKTFLEAKNLPFLFLLSKTWF